MHTTVLTNLYPPRILGGYELLARDLVEWLRSRGHRVNVLTTGGGSSMPGVSPTLRLARDFGTNAGKDRLRHLLAAARNARATAEFLEREGRPDAVLAMSQRRLGLEPLRVFQRAGVPVVFTVNDDWPNAYATSAGTGVRGALGRWVDRAPIWAHTFRGVQVDRVVYLSRSVRAEVQRELPSWPEGIVQPQGVDLRRFLPRPFRPVSGSVKLLFVGRLHPSKAPDVALDTLAALRARGVQATLDLAGTPVDEAYGRQLRERAASLSLQPHVRWLGQVHREHLPSVYQSADVVLFLNRWAEPLGLTYLEAMACGVPVVAFPMGGARELLSAHPVAQLAGACEGASVSAAIEQLVADPSRQQTLVTDALRMLRDVASLDKYAETIEGELEASCAGARAAHSSH